MKVLYTERLVLRAWEESDAEALYEYAKDPLVGPPAGWPPHQSLDESRRIVSMFIGKECFAICLRGENTPVGSIELKLKTDMTDRADECELGYVLARKYWGRGIMPEAAREIIRYGFEDLNMRAIWCGYYDGNQKSKRVQEKVGFRYHHTTEEIKVPLLHEVRTGHVNLLTRDDWEAARRNDRKVKGLTVVSLSRGLLGEEYVGHEIEIGEKRLSEYGIDVHYSDFARVGQEQTAAHPEKRAEDLLAALGSDTDMILCAVGGDDTYRLLPYLFGGGELQSAACDKIFLGFSDTTANHFMLHKVGMRTFYGQAFLPDVCELSPGMLPYTERYFRELISTGRIKEIRPSDVWYEAREDFSPAAVGTTLPSHPNDGFRLLQGSPVFSGEILGGCIDAIFDFFDGGRYPDSPALCRQYGLFPSLDGWAGKILLLETSEETPTPEKYRRMIRALKKTGIFGAIGAVLLGKPVNEIYAEDYYAIITEEVGDPALPIVANLNVGHALPRCIVPFGVPATVDVTWQVITFDYGSEGRNDALRGGNV